MPELPEVQTTVNGINELAKKWKIRDVWTDYRSSFHSQKNNIKNPKFFVKFKKQILDTEIESCTRRAKNILIHLSNQKTILIHLKMTGHVMCGDYKYHKNQSIWKPLSTDMSDPLNDPFNRFIHLVFTLEKNIRGQNKIKHLVLSDTRKFAKVTLLDTPHLDKSDDLSHLGIEPLDKICTYSMFVEQLGKRPDAPIKQVLMDQTLITGIGNIYSDEILWQTNVHPKSTFAGIPGIVRKTMFKAMKELLLKGIRLGGDSMSDYRNIHGLPGNFQKQHKAYQKTHKKCEKKGCTGIIERIIVGSRSTHFCPKHQIKY